MDLIAKLIITISLIFIGSALCSGQDIIVKKDGHEVQAKIVEINDTQIKYYEFSDINNLLFIIDRALIKEIRFESGVEYLEDQKEWSGNSEIYYAGDRINNVKVNFYSLGSGDLILTYERALGIGSSAEATVKVYGIGDGDSNQNDNGVGIYLGYKIKMLGIFKNTTEFRLMHILEGGYFRPVIGYSYSKSRGQSIFSARRVEKDSYVHIGLDVGKQWILRNYISFDLYIGYHLYGGSFTTSDRFAEEFNQVNTINDGDINGRGNRALAFGFRIGGLFSKMGVKKVKSRD